MTIKPPNNCSPSTSFLQSTRGDFHSENWHIEQAPCGTAHVGFHIHAWLKMAERAFPTLKWRKSETSVQREQLEVAEPSLLWNCFSTYTECHDKRLHASVEPVGVFQDHSASLTKHFKHWKGGKRVKRKWLVVPLRRVTEHHCRNSMAFGTRQMWIRNTTGLHS